MSHNLMRNIKRYFHSWTLSVDEYCLFRVTPESEWKDKLVELRKTKENHEAIEKQKREYAKYFQQDGFFTYLFMLLFHKYTITACSAVAVLFVAVKLTKVFWYI